MGAVSRRHSLSKNSTPARASVLPDKRESESSGNGRREIAQQEKRHQSRQLIGFCHFSLQDRARGRLIAIGRDAKKTIAIATAYPMRSAVIVISK